MIVPKSWWSVFAALVVLGACDAGGPAPTQSFTVQVDVRPLPRGLRGSNIAVAVNGQDRGTLSDDGVLDIEHEGVSGAAIHVVATLPPDLMAVDGDPELRQTLRLGADGQPKPVKLAFRVDLRQVSYGVVMRIPACPNTRIKFNDRVSGKTDADGYASLVDVGTPGAAVAVALQGSKAVCRKRCVRQVPTETKVMLVDSTCLNGQTVAAAKAMPPLRVSCRPRGAKVYVDGRLYDQGCDKPIEGLSAGRHTLAIAPTAKGWCRHSVEISVPETTSINLNAQACDEKAVVAQRTTPTRPRRNLPRRTENIRRDVEPVRARPAARGRQQAYADAPVTDRPPPSPPPPVVPKRPKKVGDRRVRVYCQPSGLNVLVDGQVVAGGCNRSVTVNVQPGLHKFELRSPPGGDIYIPDKVIFDVSPKKSNSVRLTAKERGDCYMRLASVPRSQRGSDWVRCMSSLDAGHKSFVNAKSALAEHYWPKNPRKVRDTLQSLLNSRVAGIRRGNATALMAAAEVELGRHARALALVEDTRRNLQTTSKERQLLMYQAWAKASYEVYRKSPKDLASLNRALEASEQLREMSDSPSEKKTMTRRVGLLSDKKKQLQESRGL